MRTSYQPSAELCHLPTPKPWTHSTDSCICVSSLSLVCPLPPSHSQAYGNGFGSSLSKGEKVSSQMQRRRDVPTPMRPDRAPHSSREHFVEQELSADSASSSVSLSLTVRTISRKISSIRSWLGSSSFQRPTGIISRIRQRYRAWCPGALASRGAGATLDVELQVCLDFQCVVLFFFFFIPLRSL